MIIKQPPGYDTSYWESIPDFALVSPRPLYVATKATEGLTIKDPTFIRYFTDLGYDGIRRGAYHFFRKLYKAQDQAKHFCDTVRPYVTDKDVLELDFEEGGESAAQLLDYLRYVRSQFPNNLIMVYSRALLMNAISMTLAQAAEMRKYPVWVAGYPTTPDFYSSVPSMYIPDQTKWGKVYMWQYSDSAIVQGIKGEVDANWLAPEFIDWLGGTMVNPSQDFASALMPGVTQVSGVRNGWRFWLQIVDPLKMRYEVVNLPTIATVSSIAKSRGAAIGWNGSDYDRVTHQLHWGAPSLYVSGDFVDVKNDDGGDVYCVRPLIVNGVISPRLYEADAAAQEGHARHCIGKTADGKIMHMVSEGAYPNQGLRLVTCAEVMKQYGAVLAGDAGGGGDATLVINGNVINETENIVNGIHLERPLPQVVLLYPKETSTGVSTMDYKANVDAKLWASCTNGVFSREISPIKAGTIVHGGAPLNGVLQLTNPVGFTKAQWFTVISGTVTPPPTTTEVKPTRIIVELDNGAKWEATQFTKVA